MREGSVNRSHDLKVAAVCYLFEAHFGNYGTSRIGAVMNRRYSEAAEMLEFKQQTGDIAVLHGKHAYVVRTVNGKPSIVLSRTQDGTTRDALLPNRWLSERQTREILAHITAIKEQA